MPEVRRADWESLSQLERNCAFWTETHRLILEALAGRPSYLRMRLEDLGDDAAVERMARFFDVAPPDRDALAAVRRTRFNAKDDEKREGGALRSDILPQFAQGPAERPATPTRPGGEMAAPP